MNKEQIKETICSILTSPDKMALNIDTVGVTGSLSLIDEYALDSIQILELIVNIEKTFKICVDTDTISLDIFDKFSDLVGFVQNELMSGGEGSKESICTGGLPLRE